MPRPLRIQYQGAWYHVMNRGINRQPIFRCDTHRRMFLTLLNELTCKFQAEIHAFCLMGNHYHLLIRTQLANLSKCMQHLDGVYTQRLNRIVKRDGALFRGRYKAILVEADSYLLQVSRYIHLNPVTAKICLNPCEYQWSSYSAYVNPKVTIPWLTTSSVLNYMGDENTHDNYSKFVSRGNDKVISDFYDQQQLPSILGEPDFIMHQLGMLSEDYVFAVSTDFNRTKSLPSGELIIDCIMQHFRLTREMLNKSTQGKRNWEKMIAVYLLIDLAQLTHQQAAKYFNGLKPASIGTIMSRCKHLLESNSHFCSHVHSLRQKVCQHEQC